MFHEKFFSTKVYFAALHVSDLRCPNHSAILPPKKHRELRLINKARPALSMITFGMATCAFDTSAEHATFLETPLTMNGFLCLLGVLGWTNWRRFGGSSSVPVGFPIPKRDGPCCWIRPRVGSLPRFKAINCRRLITSLNPFLKEEEHSL